jgi:iron-sulfur cluster repair protein YtfE (RIC family)
MKEDHNEADEDLAALAALTTEIPEKIAKTPAGRELLQLFQELEETLQGQIYQENQVLFRRAFASIAPKKRFRRKT